MTTYELPPEPPIGSRVTDSLGRTWNHPERNRWSLPGSDSGLPWATILIYSPVTLIEPEPSDMNPDDIATETIMPEAFLALAREMVAQKSPEAAAMAALAWALRHAPVDGGSLEISGHRIERIAPEPDLWPTHELIVADWSEGSEGGRGLLMRGAGDEGREYFNEHATLWKDSAADTLTNVVPVRVVPVAELDALRACIKALGYSGHTSGMSGSLLDTTTRLLSATDALGVAEG